MKYLKKFENFDFNDEDFDEEEIEFDYMDLDLDLDRDKFIMYKWVSIYRLCYLVKKNYGGDTDHLSVWDVDKRNPKLNCYDDRKIRKII